MDSSAHTNSDPVVTAQYGDKVSPLGGHQSEVLNGMNQSTSSTSGASDSSPTDPPVVTCVKNRRKKRMKGDRIIIKSLTGTKYSSINPTGPESFHLQTLPISRSNYFANNLGHTGTQTFPNRTDFSAFKRMLPKHLVNSFHIKVEDEYYSGRDEIKAFILSTFAKLKSSSTRCILCKNDLTVFNRYPMIDGTFFLSPLKHDDFCCGMSISSVRMMVGYSYQALYEGSGKDYGGGEAEVFLCAVCVKCMSGANAISCNFCGSLWQAGIHQLGTLYKYDLLSANQCCIQRTLCTSCSQPVVNTSEKPIFFSTPSEVIQCPHCQSIDYHLLRPSLTYRVIPESYSRI